MRHLYTLLLSLSLPLVFLRLYWRGRRNKKYRHCWEERLGFVTSSKKISNNTIWLHAVSVGETEATVSFVKKLLKEQPDLQVIITNTTPTGADTVTRRYVDEIDQSRVVQLYTPYDLPGILKRFLKTIKPRVVIVMETEIWPNMIQICWQKKIPLILANARMAERSFKGYKRFSQFASDSFSKISLIAAQTEHDAKRIESLGAKPDNVIVSGSLKFDLNLPEDLTHHATQLRQQLGSERPVWVAGSTHEGEEQQVLDAHKEILKTQTDCLLILVPRHPERFETVFELCQRLDFNTARRSQDQQPSTDNEVYLVDTMGDLLLCYAAADIAFVAGSLTPIGGHNPLEPASLGLPILMGPHTFKVEKIFQDFLDTNAALRVEDSHALTNRVKKLLSDEKSRRELGENARKLMQEKQGATDKLVSSIKHFLEGNSPH